VRDTEKTRASGRRNAGVGAQLLRADKWLQKTKHLICADGKAEGLSPITADLPGVYAYDKAQVIHKRSAAIAWVDGRVYLQ
jgi:hypothetical protein